MNNINRMEQAESFVTKDAASHILADVWFSTMTKPVTTATTNTVPVTLPVLALAPTHLH